MNQNSDELLFDLLVKQAVEGLSDAERVKLEQLEKGREPDVSVDLTASAIALVDIDAGEPMPAHLRASILRDADSYFANREQAAAAERASRRVPEPKSSSMWNWLGWATAAAACLVLALNIWTTRIQERPDTARVPEPAPTQAAPPVPEQRRQMLMETAADLTKAEWAAGNVKEAAGVSGDVVWSDAEQVGYMRFRGLPANDPKRETYQLWIFDETQDEKTPIDGGTFNVNDNGEVVIPIDARLAARNPKMFAVTVEKPGGVVVSKREKIVAIAKTET